MTIELFPPIEYGRYQKWGITTRISIDGRCKNAFKVVSQYYGLEETGPLLEAYKKMGLKGHNGFDIVLFTGDKVLAAHDGLVTYIDDDITGGIGLELWSEEGKFKTIYWHNEKNLVVAGQYVRVGEPIAIGDNTGFSTGSHLHWGLKLTDENSNTIKWGNGYRGAINPRQYLVDKNMNLTKEQVIKIYILFGLGTVDAEALEHWTNRQLDELLNTRMVDLHKEIHLVVEIK